MGMDYSWSQFGIGDKEGGGDPDFHGYWAMWERSWITFVSADGRPALHVSRPVSAALHAEELITSCSKGFGGAPFAL